MSLPDRNCLNNMAILRAVMLPTSHFSSNFLKSMQSVVVAALISRNPEKTGNWEGSFDVFDHREQAFKYEKVWI